MISIPRGFLNGIKFSTGSLICFLTGTLLSAEANELQRVDVFQAGDQGVALYRIPGMVVTEKGTILAYCEARKDSRADWGEIEVHLKRSIDGGKTWGPSQHIAHLGERLPGNPHKAVGGDQEQTVNNPVAIVDRERGLIHFLYCINYARCFYMSSRDDGATFSAPVEITQIFEGFRKTCDWKVIATGPGHGIQLRGGRLCVPVWLAYGKTGAHSPSMCGTIYSDDHGQTWRAGDVAVPNTEEFRNPNECVVAELSDGRVILNARSVSEPSRRIVTTSPDGASHWSPPTFDKALVEPICMGSLIRIPGGKGQGLLFCNPHSLKKDAEGKEVPGGRGERKNLSLKVSEDDGKNWSAPVSVEEGTSAYSDLALLTDQLILCLYEQKDRITLARVPMKWLSSKVQFGAESNRESK